MIFTAEGLLLYLSAVATLGILVKLYQLRKERKI